MKRIFSIFFLAVFLIGIYAGWNVLGPVVAAPENKFLYIKSGSSFEEVKNQLVVKKILSHTFFFNLISTSIKYNQHIKPGRYLVKDGSSLLSFIRMLKSGNQEAVRLVITKLRTKEDLAAKIGENFEVDSSEAIHFLTSNDSLASYHLDTNTVMTTFIPNSYLLWWNSSFSKILLRLKKQHDYFWDGERSKKAKEKGFTIEQIYTISSIVEEETNMDADKGKIASVYINRIKKGMKLEADPTVKYAMRNFELKRILHGHLTFPSDYNTYQNTGLPPGPICTPSITTIDAVLNAPTTDYIFFVAKPDFSGYSNFANSYNEHLVNAKLYQHALDQLQNNHSTQK